MGPSAKSGPVKKAFENGEILEKWEKTAWAKKLATRKKRTTLTDFDRFKLKLAKQKVCTTFAGGVFYIFVVYFLDRCALLKLMKCTEYFTAQPSFLLGSHFCKHGVCGSVMFITKVFSAQKNGQSTENVFQGGHLCRQTFDVPSDKNVIFNILTSQKSDVTKLKFLWPVNMTGNSAKFMLSPAFCSAVTTDLSLSP